MQRLVSEVGLMCIDCCQKWEEIAWIGVRSGIKEHKLVSEVGLMCIDRCQK